jgi:hypothetical protein
VEVWVSLTYTARSRKKIILICQKSVKLRKAPTSRVFPPYLLPRVAFGGNCRGRPDIQAGRYFLRNRADDETTTAANEWHELSRLRRIQFNFRCRQPSDVRRHNPAKTPLDFLAGAGIPPAFTVISSLR